MWLCLAVLLGLYFLRRWYWERQTVESLTEKHVFIIGCDSGFGNQLARQLDIRGLRVLAACYTQKGAEQPEKATGLWGLVNNAATGTHVAPNEWLTKDNFVRVINVNLLGTIDVTLHMLPLVRAARGRVITVSSVGGRLVTIGGGYSPSKFGVEAFLDSLRRELLPFGVKVSIIEPGAFITSLAVTSEDSLKSIWDQVPSDIKQIYGQQYLEGYCKLFRNLMKGASNNLHPVTDCMEHALTSCYSRTRYSAGWDTKLFQIPLSYMPTAVADYVLACSSPKPAQAL